MVGFIERLVEGEGVKSEIQLGFRNEVERRGDDVTCKVHPFGATITKWQVGDRALLYRSELTKINDGQEFRGGVPIVFPQFGNVEPPNPAHALPQHGFAQYLLWSPLPKADQVTNNTVSIQFELTHQHLREQRPELFVLWPYEFKLIYTITLTTTTLDCSITVENLSIKEFIITPLFHTHLQLSDVRQAHVDGIQDWSYYDKLPGVPSEIHPRHGPWSPLSGEIDRILNNSKANPLILVDPIKDTKLSLQPTSNLTSLVIWNPWPSDKPISNVGNPSHLHMLCLELGRVMDPLTIKSQTQVQYGQTLQLTLP